MPLLLGHDAEVADWVARHIEKLAPHVSEFAFGQVFGPCAAIGVLDSAGQLIGGVVYHNYNPVVGDMHLSCAATSAGWLSPRTLRALLRYAFEQAHCQRVTAVTPRRGTRVRRFLEGLDFRREGSLRRGFRDDNAIIYGLLREDWEAHRVNQPRERLTDGQIVQGAPSA